MFPNTVALCFSSSGKEKQISKCSNLQLTRTVGGNIYSFMVRNVYCFVFALWRGTLLCCGMFLVFASAGIFPL